MSGGGSAREVDKRETSDTSPRPIHLPAESQSRLDDSEVPGAWELLGPPGARCSTIARTNAPGGENVVTLADRVAAGNAVYVCTAAMQIR